MEFFDLFHKIYEINIQISGQKILEFSGRFRLNWLLQLTDELVKMVRCVQFSSNPAEDFVP